MTVTTPPRPGAAPYRFVISGSVLVLQVGMGMNFLAVAPLFPLIVDDFGVDQATVGLLVSASSLAVALALLPGSVLAGRLGSRTALALGGLCMSVAALAPLAGSFPLLLGTRVVFALGAAITLGTVPGIVMRWFPERELPLVNGANVVGQSLGMATSMLAGAAIAEAVGWQQALLAFGSVNAVGTLLWLALAREPARGAAPVAPQIAARDIVLSLRDRTTLLLALGVAGGLGAYISLSSWLPTHYHEEFGFSLQRAGAVTALLSFFGIAGSLLGSMLPLRVPARRPFLMLAGVTLPLLGLGSFMVSEPLILYPSIALFGVMAWLYFPVVFTIPMELPGMTPERVGVVVAAVMSAGNVSGFVFPLVVGVLSDQTGGFRPGLALCSGLAAALLIAGYLLPETGRRRATPLPVATPEAAG